MSLDMMANFIGVAACTGFPVSEISKSLGQNGSGDAVPQPSVYARHAPAPRSEGTTQGSPLSRRGGMGAEW